MKKISKKQMFEFLYINIGVMLVALSFSLFLEPNNIVAGGVSGIGIILRDLFSINPAFIIMAINILLLVVGLLFLGKDFFIKTVYGSIMFPVYTWVFSFVSSSFASQINDMIIITIFASLIMGLGIGLVMKNGGTTGGVEVLQTLLFKYAHLPFSTSLFIIDGAIVLAGMLVFGIEIGLYAIIFIYLSGLIIDNVVFGGFNKRAAYIITNHPDEIKIQIFKILERGVTEIMTKGGYTGESRKMLLCVLSTKEYYHLRKIVQTIDKKAFVFVARTNEVIGEGFTFDEETPLKEVDS
ncbi:MAG TPA: YitT family protein [Bacilli bacterium]|nr:YitT family protein [Bacilli bacterium]